MVLTHGFELVREQRIPELNTNAKIYRHAKTGAQLLSMENDDENKVFGISFFTPPADSTGIAHIMEHSVLCGSRKYPVKEPFVELIKGSLNTFLNAFTFPDKTCYPVASQNRADFYNLIDVYLDSVFYPRITPHILQQEGWHLELENEADPLIYKGVVFNEMKGAYSSPEGVFGRYTQQSLFPDTIYGLDSGGDPSVIPNLTYENFKKFHKTYYHPSNALIYFYGDDHSDDRLRMVDDYLKDFDAKPVKRGIALQPRFSQPKRITQRYDAGPDGDKKGMVTVNWLLTDAGNPEMTLSLEILGYLLIGTQAAPLRKALIDSGLGEDLVGAGLETDLSPMYFSTGLKGIAVEDADKVQAVIVDTLNSLAKNGIEQELLEAALNTIEFRLRENNTGNFPRGLALMIGALSTWLHDQDPLAPLAFEQPLQSIKARVAKGERVFESLIEQFMLNNTHRTTVIMEPDPEYNAREEADERARLDKIRAELSSEQVQQVIENTKTLKQMQITPDKPEDLAKIPSLTLTDLDKENKKIPIAVSEAQGAKLLYHDIFTNGIVYLDLGLNLHTLPQEYLPLVSLFSRSLTALGTDTEDYVKLSRRIGRKTGGISTAQFTSMIREEDRGTSWLFLRAKGTPDQAGDMLDILRDILLTVKLDNQERFKQIALEEKARHEARLVPSGHQVAYQRLRSAYNEADWASEQMGGIEYLFHLRGLIEQIDNDWASVLGKLQAIKIILVNRNSMLANVTLDADNWSKFQPKLNSFLAALPAAKAQQAQWKPTFNKANEGLTIPAQVNYVAKGADIFRLGYELDGSSSVITNLLRTAYLWERVRVQGGAYGGFVVFNDLSGMLSYLSYRDPNLLATVKNYDGASDYLRGLHLTQDEVTRSIIGAIGDLDAYQLPDAKGYTSMIRYLTGETDQTLQQYREEVLTTTPDDFRRFAEILESVNREGRVVVIGSVDAIEQANVECGGEFLEVKKVL